MIYPQIQIGVNSTIRVGRYARPDPVSVVGELACANAGNVIVGQLNHDRAPLIVYYPTVTETKDKIVESGCGAVLGEILRVDGVDVQEE